MESQADVRDEWCSSITQWEQALHEMGRTPHTVRLWVSFVRRAGARVSSTPKDTAPSDLMAALASSLGSAATRANARTAIRSFYLHLGYGHDDPLMMPGRKWTVAPEWSAAIRAWEVWLRVGGRSAGTVWLRVYHLRRCAEQLTAGPWDVQLADLVSVLDNPGWSAETRKSARSALRSFYTWAMDVERITVDPTRRLPTAPIPAGRPRPTPDAVFQAALAAADDESRLMLLLAAYAGLRRAEIAAVHSRDIVEGSLRVVGKGMRTRVIPLHPVLADALADLDGWAFPGRFDDHAHPDKVGNALSRLLGPGWTAHTLRHRFASRAYAAQRDIRAVQELLGHSKLETTQRYTAVPDDALRLAVLNAG